jgi:hypothetical protein
MTAENFDAVLGTLLNRRPFQIFTVELNGGKRFEIDHPQATVFRDGLAVFVAPGPTLIHFDHDSVSQIIEAPASAAP